MNAVIGNKDNLLKVLNGIRDCVYPSSAELTNGTISSTTSDYIADCYFIVTLKDLLIKTLKKRFLLLKEIFTDMLTYGTFNMKGKYKKEFHVRFRIELPSYEHDYKVVVNRRKRSNKMMSLQTPSAVRKLHDSTRKLFDDPEAITPITAEHRMLARLQK